MQTILHTPPTITITPRDIPTYCAQCPEVARLRDALAAADRLLLDLGARRADSWPQTWDDLVTAVEARESGRCPVAP